jgi:flagellar biosynthetic protein FlhB
MKENEDGTEKKHEPTAKRISEARADGKVAQSKDINSTAQLAAVIFSFAFWGAELTDKIMATTRWSISESARYGKDAPSLLSVLGHQAKAIGSPLMAICIVLAAAALIAGLAQTEMNFTWKPLLPDVKKLNPMTRFASLFGPKKLGMNLLLSTAKIAVGALVMGILFWQALPAITGLARSPLSTAQVFVMRLLFEMLLATTVVLGLMAAVDYWWQKKQHREEMMMTDEEVKREREEQEGKPIFKNKRKGMHRALTFNRIIKNVPEADVILTNPTHLAIALKYQPGLDAAPLVTAKGADAMALQMRHIARRHGVPIIENKPLARVMWQRVEIGHPIPNHLFQAVAEILARVYRIRNRRVANHAQS